jgi:hypothetical protein
MRHKTAFSRRTCNILTETERATEDGDGVSSRSQSEHTVDGEGVYSRRQSERTVDGEGVSSRR